MTTHTTITTLEQFDRLTKEIRDRRAYTQAFGYPYRQEFYRGQLQSKWEVKPSLTRLLKTDQQVIEAENQILKTFKDEIQAKNYLHRIFLHSEPHKHQNDWAWLMQAQHYGIPTRMLDWTLKPEVALYFAIDNALMDDEDGAFLVLYYPLDNIITENIANTQFYDTHPENIPGTWFMNPGFYERDLKNTTAETRRARQHGRFSIQTHNQALTGLDRQPEFLIPWNKTWGPVIEKYIIPAQYKVALRLGILERGWSGEFLYQSEDDTINEIAAKCKQKLEDMIVSKVSPF